MSTATTVPATITEHEAAEIEEANATGRVPVVFIHGLWLLPSSWDRWATVFEEAGFTALTPGWPEDPDTVEEAAAHPEVFAHKTVGQVADEIVEIPNRGHSLTIDRGWREVADTAAAFVKRFT
jgi:non-heme chloroperoxidase